MFQEWIGEKSKVKLHLSRKHGFKSITNSRHITISRLIKEGIIERVCPICKGSKWKRTVDEGGYIIEGCTICGYHEVVDVPYQPQIPSATSDHWDGSTDNREKILEKEYEKGKR